MIALTHRVFLEVAAHLSFSKASKALFISQPAVSKQIKILENRYKLPLFERKGNSILITEAGEKLYQYLLEAREITKKAAREKGVLLAPEGTAVWKATQMLIDENWIKADENVLILNTGTGYKYLDNIIARQ